MTGVHENLRAGVTQQGRDGRLGPAAAADGVADAADWAEHRAIAAVIGLSVAGALAPVAVAWVAATNPLLWQPLAAGALVALLVLAPVAVAATAALAGFRRIAAVAAGSGGEAEHAVLRVFAATLLFGYALALSPFDARAADCVPLAAPGVVAAWVLLLCVIVWPAPAPPRRVAGIAFDVTLLSAFLHLGGSTVAGWYVLYLTEIFYVGLRFGLAALFGTTAAAVVGFAAVVLSTEGWRSQPALAAGLVVALAVLPAFVAGAIRALTAAAGNEADRQRALLLIANALRGPAATRRTVPAAPAASAPIGDIRDFAALEAGSFAPPVETFDLRLLVNDSLMPLQAAAAQRGVAVRWRVDPRLPFRLRGQAQAVARILRGLVEHAVDDLRARVVRIVVDAGGGEGRRIALRLRLDALDARREAGVLRGEMPLALHLVERLAEIAGGTVATGRAAGRHRGLAVTVPLAIEAGAAFPSLDLAGRPVFIATDDDELARDLAEPLAVWRADLQWPGGADATLVALSDYAEDSRPVVIVDGRGDLLSALSLAHHAATLEPQAAFVLLLVDEAQLGSLGDLDTGRIDGLIPLPVDEPMLANALYALPLVPPRGMPPPRPVPQEAPPAPPPRANPGERPHRPPASPPARPPPAPPTPAAEPAESEADRITPIAAHPRFVPELVPAAPPAAAGDVAVADPGGGGADDAGAVDLRLIDSLCALGSGPGFLRDVVETFRADANRLMARIEEAAAAGDAARFARSLAALRHAAGHLGGTRLGQVAVSLQDQDAAELRQHGAGQVERLAAEVDRLTTALIEAVPAAEARRR